MKPHLIVIMADQLRNDVLGKGFTPNIDAIRNEGVDFSRTYCACPLCVPARGAFFTGLCPNSNGSLINPWEPVDAHYGDVRDGVDNLYSMMEEGWCSIHSGKQHLFTKGGKLEDRMESKTIWASTEKSYKDFLRENGIRMPGGPRFKTYVPEMVDGKVTKVSRYSNAEVGCYDEDQKYYFDRFFADKAVEALKRRDTSKPLLLNLMLLAPHPPLEIPMPWYQSVKPEDFELPGNVGRFYPHQSVLQMYNLTGIVGSHYTRGHWQKAWCAYLGLVRLLDDCVGQVVAEIKRQGIYDDSLIVFTSDHGEMLGSHALFQKMCMYEESVRVPLFMKFPVCDRISPCAIPNPVSHLDVLPTLCDYYGLKSGNAFEGRSLLGCVFEGRTIEEKDIFIQYDGNGSRSNFQRCVISGRYKLIVDLFKDEYFIELYDVVSDPEETDNLVFHCVHDEIIRDLYGRLSRHMADTGDMISLPFADMEDFRRTHSAFPVK